MERRRMHRNTSRHQKTLALQPLQQQHPLLLREETCFRTCRHLITDFGTALGRWS